MYRISQQRSLYRSFIKYFPLLQSQYVFLCTHTCTIQSLYFVRKCCYVSILAGTLLIPRHCDCFAYSAKQSHWFKNSVEVNYYQILNHSYIMSFLELYSEMFTLAFSGFNWHETVLKTSDFGTLGLQEFIKNYVVRSSFKSVFGNLF